MFLVPQCHGMVLIALIAVPTEFCYHPRPVASPLGGGRTIEYRLKGERVRFILYVYVYIDTYVYIYICEHIGIYNIYIYIVHICICIYNSVYVAHICICPY